VGGGSSDLACPQANRRLAKGCWERNSYGGGPTAYGSGKQALTKTSLQAGNEGGNRTERHLLQACLWDSSRTLSGEQAFESLIFLALNCFLLLLSRPAAEILGQPAGLGSRRQQAVFILLAHCVSRLSKLPLAACWRAFAPAYRM